MTVIDMTDWRPPPLPEPDEEFWSARPWLTDIRAWARAKRAGPYATVGEVIAGTHCRISPAIQTPDLIGGNGTLNMLIAITAASGIGKGAATECAADAVDWGGRQVETIPAGSGEGLAKSFGIGKRNADTGDYEVERTRRRALFTAAEIDAYAALVKRSGATLSAQLRSLYSGEGLGFGYADETKRVLIPRHSYRACLIAGVQPRRGAAILGDADGGLPQRFLWLPGSDPAVPDVKPDAPPRIAWEPAAEIARIKDDETEPVVLDVCKQARDEIDRGAVMRHRGEVDALDGHVLYTQLKTAAALALFEGRAEVTEEDWQLAGHLIAVSGRVRDSVTAELRAVQVERNAAQGYDEAARASIVSDATGEREERNRDKAAQSIVAALRKSGDGMPGAVLRRGLTSRLRAHFDAALADLIETGQVERDVTDSGHGRDGFRYRVKP